ncbi:MAG: hypothetical protein KatS3mg039_1044 [Candidatus Kapaibacterium sp.]|nr:MAG: hypothetical protein KatS3mg039_1044 [Candidatus Kapabacteria bacterium]
MTRRGWLEVVFHAGWGVGLGWLMAALLRQEPLRRAQFRKVAACTETELRSSGLLHMEINRRPIVMRAHGQDILALDLRCTHGNCIVRYEPAAEQFFCPCHGGVFDAEGKVVSGPPPAPLSRVPLRRENGIVYVLDQS